MLVEIARVICSRCYEDIIKEFPEITLEQLENESERCIVFNHCYALCKNHLEELANKL